MGASSSLPCDLEVYGGCGAFDDLAPQIQGPQSCDAQARRPSLSPRDGAVDSFASMLSAWVVDETTDSGPEDFIGESMFAAQQCVDQAENWRQSIHDNVVVEVTVYRHYRLSSQAHSWRALR